MKANEVGRSADHLAYIKKYRAGRRRILLLQLSLLVGFLLLWQLAAEYELINTVIFSSPKAIANTFVTLLSDGTLWSHVGITLAETSLGFLLGTLLGTFIAMLLWWFPFWAKVADPYLVVLNALPKVALGPVIIVWAGAGPKSILIMTLAISLIATIIGVYSGFAQIDGEKLTLLRSFGANRAQIMFKLLLPASSESILSALKINVGLSWVGVIMGEFLVSKAGIGYLIMYGSQVFNLNLVMTGIIILCVAAALMYLCVGLLEKRMKDKYL